MALLLPARARIEPFEEREAVCKHFVVIWIRGEKPSESQVDPARLVARKLTVAKVRLAPRRIEKVEFPKFLEVLGELGQVPVDPRTRGGGLPLEGLDQLPVARRKLPVLWVAGLMEQANDVRPAHVLDLIHA